MKKILTLLFCLSLILGILPSTLWANEGYNRSVEMIGQWTNESATQQTTIKTFSSATDKLGAPLANPGLLRGLAKNFLGWSTAPLNADKTLPEGARLFSQEDRISTVFPEGIPEDARLYAIYFELNEGPLVINSFWDNVKLLNLFNAEQYEIINRDNSILLNKFISDEDTTVDTDLIESNANDSNRTERRIIDRPNLEKDNAIRIDAHFKMSQILDMLVYKNPRGSNAILPIFSRNYATQRRSENGFSVENPDYTYVDLSVELDERFEVGEAYHLEFSSYSWRPLYVLDEQNKKMDIAHPLTAESLGNSHSAFNSLVSNTSPVVPFTVLNPNKSHKISIRVILRDGAGEKIPEEAIVPSEGLTIAEEITKDMRLVSLDKNQLLAKMPNYTEEDLRKNTITIKKDTIQAMLDGKEDATSPLRINGYIEGKAVVDAGKLSFFDLKVEIPIERLDVKLPILISFRKEIEESKDTPIIEENDDGTIEIPDFSEMVEKENTIKDLVPNTGAGFH